MNIKDELKAKYPGLTARAETQRLAAIRLFCIECMGGSGRDAKACAQKDCFLWPHRGASWKPGIR